MSIVVELLVSEGHKEQKMTATMTRNDVHRPSVINPEDYDFVSCIYIGPSPDFELAMESAEGRKTFNRHRERTGGRFSGHEHGGTCHVCGATAMYLAIFHHPPTNTYINVGEDCAAKLDMGDSLAFNGLRRAIANAREAHAGKMKAKAILAEAGLARAWELRDAGLGNKSIELLRSLGALRELPSGTLMATGDYRTLCDIVDRLVRYGNISDKAIAFLRTLVERVDNLPAVEAAKKAEHDAAPDCPEGKVVVEGEVLSTRVEPGIYGIAYKMLVKDNRGFKVWSTVPSALVCLPYADGTRMVARGDKVKFTATLSKSDRDPKFGFAKRPTKATCSTADDAACIERFNWERSHRD